MIDDACSPLHPTAATAALGKLWTTMLKRSRNHLLRSLNRRRPMLAMERLEGRWVPSATTWHDLEPNDTPAQAQSLAVLSPLDHAQIDGAIDHSADVDWFRFDLSERSDVALQLTGVGAVSLFQADPNHPNLLVPVVAGQPLAAGAYFASVSAAAGATGSYLLALDVALPPAAGTLAAPVDLGVIPPADPSGRPQSVSARRDYRNGADTHSGDADYFQFTVTVHDLYSVLVVNAHGAPVARVTWVDGDGNALTPSFAASDSQHRVLILDLEPGTYRLKVNGWDAAEAGQVAYTLRITTAMHENPTPLPAAPAAPYRLRLRLTTNDPPAAVSAAAPAVAQAPRLSLPDASNDPEPQRFVSTVRLSGVLGADLSRPNGSAAGLSAGPVGVATGTNGASSGPLRLSLPTESFAGLDSRGGFTGDHSPRDPLGAPSSLAWLSESAGQLAREWVFQSIHWLNLPPIQPPAETLVAELPQAGTIEAASALDASALDASARFEARLPALGTAALEVVMPASPQRAMAMASLPSAWLMLGVLAGAGGMLHFAAVDERRRGTPAFLGPRCEGS